MNITSPQAFHFATYEAVMLWLNPEKSYNPYHHALAGAVAGGVAATAALPLDACKTLLNTQEVAPAQYTCICVLYNAPVPEPWQPSFGFNIISGERAQTAQCWKRDRTSWSGQHNLQDGWC